MLRQGERPVAAACQRLRFDSVSHALLARLPDVLVELELHANGELVLEHPADQLSRQKLTEDGAREKVRRERRELSCFDDSAHPLVVAAIAQDEFDLVSRR